MVHEIRDQRQRPQFVVFALPVGQVAYPSYASHLLSEPIGPIVLRLLRTVSWVKMVQAIASPSSVELRKRREIVSTACRRVIAHSGAF
jgi:hypothetical protein